MKFLTTKTSFITVYRHMYSVVLTLCCISVLDSPCWVSMLVGEEGVVSHITAFINILDSLHFVLTLLLGLQDEVHYVQCTSNATYMYCSIPKLRPPFVHASNGKIENREGSYAHDSDVTPITDDKCRLGT